ncbi:zinc uptake protein ZrgA [Vibrio sp. LaRot3]|uniref:zinc uptake protein ZrgA n=1 Tax=Vibrio sp. LaRot3 TaxID=2998829 RepID=UPI0022CDC6FB|nr:DUF2796 domain-containing protein [Vibrio sp. LaRot3]MDA0149911.1 DUF2796 domain-containing protein [Vibrio sp. LaRot3]
MTKYSPLALCLGLALSQTAMAEDHFRQHDAHVHGEVEFNIAQDGHELLVEITAPGADVVGFEHAPQNDEQKKALQQAEAHLNNANSVLLLASNAQCKLEHKSVTHTLGQDTHDDHEGHDHDKHDHDHEGHDHDKHDHDHEGHDHDKHDHDHEGHDHDKHDHDHEGHDHDKHAHDHEGHDHDKHDHESHGGHGEFTIEYHYHCDNLAKLESIDTKWFELFPATNKVKVNLLTDTKQAALELSEKQSTIKF